jgi:hypothetical protein
MPIAVACKCGKKFRVKDEMAGRAVRCPGCRQPLRIPGGVGGGRSAAPQIDEQAALLKFEEAQKKKQISAEEEAAYVAEKKALIESYDQLSGQKTKKNGGKKKEKAGEGKPRKRTIFMKIADFFGALFGTLIAKYVLIVIVLGGGVVGSVFLVQYVTSYMAEETSAGKPNEEIARGLMVEAQADIDARRWKEAKDKLDRALRLSPRIEIRRDYRGMRQALEKGFGTSRSP